MGMLMHAPESLRVTSFQRRELGASYIASKQSLLSLIQRLRSLFYSQGNAYPSSTPKCLTHGTRLKEIQIVSMANLRASDYMTRTNRNTEDSEYMWLH